MRNVQANVLETKVVKYCQINTQFTLLMAAKNC